jgi:hypothetical protein
MHEPSSLLEVHELLTLFPHHASGDVVGTELSPRYLIVRGASDGVVGPPRAGITTQLLHGEEGLLHFSAAQEPKLGLHHPKPVSGRKVAVGGRSGGISCPISTMSRVGHELRQQLGLLVVGLKDRGDRLSQTWRWKRVPVSLGALSSSPSVASVHHLSSNMLPLASKSNSAL